MVIVSVAVIRWRNRTQFFFQDEWSVLAGRSLSDVSSIIEPHWGHNIVLPAVAYLSLFEVFGLREYAPYQALVIGAHLVVVGCLRVIMVRAGVHTWITLSACALMLVLGAGQPNVSWGFQVTLTGSLAFGLWAVVLVDRFPAGARERWRYACAALLLGLAVLCSGVGLLMVAPVGVVLASRRGWATAAAVAALPVAIYGAWVIAAPDSRYGAPVTNPVDAVAFAFRLVYFTFMRVGGNAVLGWTLIVALAAGIGVVVAKTSWAQLHSRYGTVSVLLASAGVVAVAIGRSRATISDAYEPRYVYLIAALALPALAVALDRLTRGNAPLIALGCGLLLIPIPANIGALAPPPSRAGDPLLVYALAQQGARMGTRRDFRPFPDVGKAVTIGWLADTYRSGRTRQLPADEPLLEFALLNLAMEPFPDVWGIGCPDPRPASTDLHLRVGDRFHTTGSEVRLARTRSPAPSTDIAIPADTTVEVVWGPLTLEQVGTGPVLLCGP